MKTTEVRTRFAPSPTGYLHVGGARTALFNWLFARAHGGKFILRIEDTDLERNNQESVQAIFDGMNWLGLTYDEGPATTEATEENSSYFYQSQRTDLYMSSAEQLLKSGDAYKCFATAEDLQKAREAAGVTGGYRREWRVWSEELEASDKPYVIRLKAPRDTRISFKDIIHGQMNYQANDAVDDLVLIRTNGMATYNFACVVDDYDMRITHVLRGDDHLSNTPKQIAIYQALGWPTPQFGHMPMILGPDKAKLSKRHGAVSVVEWSKEGILPEAMLNQLVRLGWSHKDDEIISMEYAIEKLMQGNFNKVSAVFDFNKLAWLNTHYMKSLTPAYLASWVGHELPESWLKVHESVISRAKNLKEVQEYLNLFMPNTSWTSVEAVESMKSVNEEIKHLLLAPTWDLETIQTYLPENKKLYQPIRMALLGTKISPPLDVTIFALGKETVQKRLETNLVS